MNTQTTVLVTNVLSCALKMHLNTLECVLAADGLSLKILSGARHALHRFSRNMERKNNMRNLFLTCLVLLVVVACGVETPKPPIPLTANSICPSGSHAILDDWSNQYACTGSW